MDGQTDGREKGERREGRRQGKGEGMEGDREPYCCHANLAASSARNVRVL